MTPAGANRMVLRPRTLGELLDAAVKLCTSNWRTLLRTVLVVVVPVQVISTIVNADYTVRSFESGGSRTTQSLDELDRYLGGLAISTLLQIAAVGLATAACLRAITQEYLGERSDWRASLAHARGRVGAVLVLTLAYVAGVAGGLVLFVVPGLWLFVAWSMAMPVLLVEGVSGGAALRRSVALVSGRWWRTLGVLLAGFVLAGVVSTLAQAVFVVGIVAVDGDDALVLTLSAVSGIVGMLLSTPLQASLLTVVYFDLRVRAEGYDVELLAHELGAPAPALAPEAEPVVAEPLWPSPAASHEAPAGEGPRPAAPPPPPPGWRP